MDYALAIDAGGTFIDFVLMDQHGAYKSFKALAKPDKNDYGIIEGLEQFAAELETTLGELINGVSVIIHGTTVATNAVLSHSGDRVALLTTEGLRDLLEMRQGVRDDLYNNHCSPPRPLVERWLRIPIRERIDYKGSIIKPLDMDFACRQLTKLINKDITAVAIVLAHSYVNPVHEQKLGELVAELLPNVKISLSHKVLPRVRMYCRVSTTVLDAYVSSVLEKYLNGLVQALKQQGYTGRIFIMQSNGGTVNVESVLQLRVTSLLSGPAAGPNVVKLIKKREPVRNAVVMDMGGTSFDVSLVRNGEPGMTDSASIAGYLIGLPTVDIHTIGAGGGSIAWVDAGGLLHVGPASAGARPGPACYGLGGQDPTCTDADLVLGLINPEYFLGGRLSLDLEKAYQAINEKVAIPLQVDVVEAALGIYKMVNTEMAAGIREITLEKGIDPREMVMVVGGGAGPLHAAHVARQLGISQLIIPHESSVMCALSMFCCGYRRDYFKHIYRNIKIVDPDELKAAFDSLWVHACSQAGEEIDNLELTHKRIYMRYKGQHHELGVDVTGVDDLDSETLSALFHQQHSRIYGYDLIDLKAEIELLGVSIVVQGKSRYPAFVEQPSAKFSSGNSQPVLKGRRMAYLNETGDCVEVPVYDGDKMPVGVKLNGLF